MDPKQPHAQIGPLTIGFGHPLTVIAGPCVIESLDHCLRLAEHAAGICQMLGMDYIFKASFDKANRSSISSPRGPGLDEGLKILATVRDTLGVAVLTDIHQPNQAQPAAQAVDALQIPAFLCRQTDLLVAAAKTGKAINIKKGQFVSPAEMANPIEKVRSAGNDNVLLTERGTFFGYNRLVNDMTGLAQMAELAPVVFDATHSCQLPGGQGTQSGGQRQFAPLLARAAVAAGVDALFLEVHDDPANAASDAATVWPIDLLEALLTPCAAIAEIVRK